MSDVDDLTGARSIMESIERRWAVADQQVFIAAVILNPFYQTKPFAPLAFLNNAGIEALLAHLWRQFYCAEPPDEFYAELREYLTHEGRYTNLIPHCARAHVEANRRVSSLDIK